MENTFTEVLIDTFTNTSGGKLQAQNRSDNLQAIGYRTTLSTVTNFVSWTNRLPTGAQDVSPQPPATAVLMLTAVKP
jgi:hypothetical protein